MKIYTKKGDAGETALYGGKRVSKSNLRLDSYGTVDELNSVLGMALSHPHTEKTDLFLKEVQNQLFVLGSDLATPDADNKKISRISAAEIEFLEESIDDMELYLPPLRNFILPGGSPAGATLHFARTVCRRAERNTVACALKENISAVAIRYLNRLSDFLFVLARFENHNAGAEETPWIPKN